MFARRTSAALALAAIMVPIASHAADVAIGTVGSGTSAFVARDGKVLPAVPGMKLYSSDRMITRAGGSASVTMADHCALMVGSSSMLPMSDATCAKPAGVAFDEGRAGYDGRSSAFQDGHPRGLWALYAALLAIWGSAAYVALHHSHHHHNNHPTSP